MKTCCILLILSAVMLSGCASIPTKDQLTQADYGSPISQKEAEMQVLDFLSQTLKDPYSAKIEWGVIQKGWMYKVPQCYANNVFLPKRMLPGCKIQFGYILKANINAKNSFGGYTGYKYYEFLFLNGSMENIYTQ